MNQRKLTDEQVFEAYKIYQEQHLSVAKLGKIYKCCSAVFLNEFKKFRLVRRDLSHSHQTFKINENYFDDINTEEKAYWLGFLFADGCCYENEVHINLAETDKHIVSNLSKVIYGEDRSKFKKKQKESRQNQQSLVIYNKHMFDTLVSIGMVPRKSLVLKFPSILKEEFYQHFIRGYFDGDGCAYINYKRELAYCSIVSTKEFCISLQEILSKQGILAAIYKRNNYDQQNTYVLYVNHRLRSEKFLSWLYRDCLIKLNRKYNKYLEIIELNKKKGKSKYVNC